MEARESRDRFSYLDYGDEARKKEKRFLLLATLLVILSVYRDCCALQGSDHDQSHSGNIRKQTELVISSSHQFKATVLKAIESVAKFAKHTLRQRSASTS
jgi:hypothetical protein